MQKYFWDLGLGIWYLVLSLFVLGCGSSENEKQKQGTKDSTEKIIYYCPMHPEVQQDHPGKCPKAECKGMELVPKMSSEMERVLKPVNASVLASVKTTKPVFKKIALDVEADGYIDYDERTKGNISSLVGGRIEKLYVRYNYQPVKKGEKVFEIYSPELSLAEENLVYILNNDAEEKTLIESAKQKLKLLGVGDGLINEVMKTKKAISTVPVYSTQDGFVYETKNMNVSSGINSNMTGTESNNQLSMKEGKYVMMGETVFNIVSKNNLAVILQIKSEDISKIQTGQEAEVDVDGGMHLSGKINFIEPLLKEGTKTMLARIYFENKNGTYKTGALVKAKIKGDDFEALWIPVSSVMDLGKEKIVWVMKDCNYIAKKVETGIVADNMIEISDGLTESDEIAIEAHYLTDSEGFIKTNEDEK